MDAFTTILSYFAVADGEKPCSDAPVESDNGGSNGGGCTVAHRPAVDAPVDADSGSNSNGGSCVVA